MARLSVSLVRRHRTRSGAGKTTTMRAIFGVVALDAGEVRWHGEPVTEQARRRFGYMPEERGLYPNMPVLDQLVYLGRLHDMPAAAARESAEQLIKRLGLQGLVLGYAFYCTAFAAAGSLVSRQSDVGTVILPVQIPLIVAYGLSYTVIYANGANGPLFYRVLGFLPPTAPVAMPVLYAAGDVPTWQVVISAVLCAAGTVWLARVAALIYSRSILRTGSRVRLREVLGSQPAA